MQKQTSHWYSIPLLALAYWLMGYLSLATTFAPSYGSIIWLSGGVATAAVLLWGKRMALGALLGNIAVCVPLFWNIETPYLSAFVLIVNGSANAIQSILAAYLIRRFVSPLPTLQTTLEVVKFISISSAAHLLAPVTGTWLHYMCGFAGAIELTWQISIWWSAEILGLATAAPATLFIFANKGNYSNSRRNVTAPVLVSGLLVAGLCLQFTLHYRDLHHETQFEREANRVTATLEGQLNQFVQVLSGVKSFWLSSNFVDEQEFASYTATSLNTYPELKTIAWIAHVPFEDREEYEKTYGHSIYEYTTQSQQTNASKRPFYLPLQYTNSLDKRLTPLGFDTYSTPDRIAGLNQSMESGNPILTQPLIPNQDPSKGSSVYLRIPVYKGNPQTVEERKASLIGFAAAALRVKSLFASLMKNTAWNQGFTASDVTDPNNRIPLYTSKNTDLDHVRNAFGKAMPIDHGATVEAHGRKWEFGYFHTLADFSATHRSWEVTLLYGGAIVITLSFALLVIILSGNSDALRVAKRQLEYKQQQLENTLQAVLDSIGDGVVTVNDDLQIKAVNSAVEQRMGFSGRELIGKNLTTLEKGKDSTLISKRAKKAIADQMQIRIRDEEGLEFHTKHGINVPVEMHITPLRLSTDQKVSVAVFRDLTEQRAKEAMILEKEAAVAATELKSSFIATMSHELRTPLNAVIGYTEMLVEEMGEISAAEMQKVYGRIISASKMLLEIINNILDLSKIESGKVDLHMERISIEKVAAEVQSVSESLAAKKENQFILDIQARGEIETDLPKLRQILVNLIGNAAKFTECGSIRLAITAKNDTLIFKISDTGIGIPKEKLPTIFEAFTQADASTTRMFGGTGLGLTIAKTFTHLLGGTITVHSHPGCGSTFSVTLPRERKPEAVSAAME